MKLNITKEQKIGFFVLATLFCSYFLIIYLKGKNIFYENSTYYTTALNVEGINTTGPVLLKGLKIGSIEKIEYLSEKEIFTIKISIESKYKLAQNSVSEIYSADLLGNKSMRIIPGDSPQYLNSGDTIASQQNAGMTNTIEKEIYAIKEKAERLFDTMNKALENINEILDEKTKSSFRESIANLASTLRGSSAIAANLNKNNEKISTIITNLDNVLKNLDQGSVDFGKSMKNISEITDSVKKADIIGTIESVKTLLTSIQDENGSIGKLIKTDSLHNSIEKLLGEINLLIDNINKNPKKYLKVSVF